MDTVKGIWAIVQEFWDRMTTNRSDAYNVVMTLLAGLLFYLYFTERAYAQRLEAQKSKAYSDVLIIAQDGAATRLSEQEQRARNMELQSQNKLLSEEIKLLNKELQICEKSK